jgi:hypothetical protein
MAHPEQKTILTPEQLVFYFEQLTLQTLVHEI